MKTEKSYREYFGLLNPPEGTVLRLKYMKGVKWYLLWEDCPEDGEDIVEGWFGTADKAKSYAKKNNWKVI